MLLLLYPEYLLLLCSVIWSLLNKRKQAILIFLASLVMAYWTHRINSYAVLSLLAFFLITKAYFHQAIKAHTPFRVVFFLAILVMAISFALHWVPGFHNALIFNQISVSPLSLPYSMYLNFDKTAVAVILFLNSHLGFQERSLDKKSFGTMLILTFFCSLTLLSSGLISGYIQFDFKIPHFLFIWSLNNLFFVSFAEEVIFRGFLQNQLEQILSQKYLSIVLSALAFSLALHFKGGISYMILSFVAGCFYALAYSKTNRITGAMGVHFGLNLIHLIFFTYPAALPSIR